MVRTCVAYKCNVKQDEQSKAKGISFFRFPKNKRKRTAWIKAINRVHWYPTEASYVCSTHFKEGWHSDDPYDENFAPTIFSYKSQPQTEGEQLRDERRVRRNLEKEMIEADESRARTEQRHKSFSIESHSGYCATAFGDHNVITSTKEARSYPDIQAEDIIMEDTNIKFQSDKENQTDICEIIQENASLRQKLKQREDDLRKHKWDHRKIKDNDAATKFYTGLPAFALFLWLFK
ncbi:hypothetical protein FSP39_001271 [Pinctada imbricata]|uniref:THAP-type domain-containing protein n=1 Tax=Pinctada imbricata TaxID=66713 RepID=A0AA89C2Y0_PINIB|nr:hypothetical protein FSP39_001271 [Pinctada imbricata]